MQAAKPDGEQVAPVSGTERPCSCFINRCDSNPARTTRLLSHCSQPPKPQYCSSAKNAAARHNKMLRRVQHGVHNNGITVMLLPALLCLWGEFPGALHTPVLGDNWFMLCAFFRHARSALAVDALCTEPACHRVLSCEFHVEAG